MVCFITGTDDVVVDPVYAITDAASDGITAVDDGEHCFSGSLKALEGISAEIRVLLDAVSDGGVRQLQEQGAASEKSNSRLVVDPADQRSLRNMVRHPLGA